MKLNIKEFSPTNSLLEMETGSCFFFSDGDLHHGYYMITDSRDKDITDCVNIETGEMIYLDSNFKVLPAKIEANVT